MSLSFPEPTPSVREERTGGEMEQSEISSSPVPSSHDMPEGFQQLIDHNNNEPTSSYPPPPQDQQQAPPPTVNMHGHLKSTPQPGYASPAKEYRHPDMIYAHHDASPYSYPENNYPSNYATEQSAYPPPPETVKTNQTPHQPYSTSATLPPTPPQQSDAMLTRSGKAIRTAQTSGGSRSYRADPYAGPSPRSKPARPASSGGGGPAKKKRKAAKEDEAEFVMEQPLSVLCAGMNVDEIDIVAYANRSVEKRRKEVVDSKNGKTKRPSNAFMLYRKAFQNRAKQLKKHDNHQIVSKICGSSWKHETEDVKRLFNELARRESELHRQAFPDYKFTPAKSTKHKEKKGGTPVPGFNYPNENRSLEDDDELELGTGIIESHPPSRGGIGPADEYRPPSASQSVNYHDVYGYHNAEPVMMQQQRLTPTPYQHTQPPPAQLSSYDYNNPGRQKPLPYGARVVQGPGGPYQQTPEMMHQHLQHQHLQHQHLQHQHLQQQTPQMYRPYMSPRQQQQQMQYMPPLRVEHVYVHQSDSAPPYGVTNSPVMGPPPPGGGGDQFGGMGPPYGNPAMMHHHGPPPHAHLTPTPPPHHQQQQQQLHQQNIDPSLMPLHAPQAYADDASRSSTPQMDTLDGFFNPGGGGEFPVDVDPDGMGYPPLPDYDYRDDSEHGLSEFERYSLDVNGGMAPPGVGEGQGKEVLVEAAGWTVERLDPDNHFSLDDLLDQRQEQDHFQDLDHPDHGGPKRDLMTPEKPSEDHAAVDAGGGEGGADMAKTKS